MLRYLLYRIWTRITRQILDLELAIFAVRQRREEEWKEKEDLARVRWANAVVEYDWEL